MERKEKGEKGEAAAAGNPAAEEVIYKIDIPANRYDMLCLEGISRALNIFNQTIPQPIYKLADMTGWCWFLCVCVWRGGALDLFDRF